MTIIVFLLTLVVATFILLVHEVVSEYLFSVKREAKMNKLMEKLKVIFSPKRCSISFKVLGVITLLLVPPAIYELISLNVFPVEIIGFSVVCSFFGIFFLKAAKEFQEIESISSEIER